MPAKNKMKTCEQLMVEEILKAKTMKQKIRILKLQIEAAIEAHLELAFIEFRDSKKRTK